jgi:phosphoribosyl 1,2-cyclic phosphodiesterase
MAEPRYTLRVWGARGTIPTPGADHARCGGNTACLAMRLGANEHVVLDCGSGLREFGRSLAEPGNGERRVFHVLLSHYHFDHLEGLPYFQPLYDPRSEIEFYGFEPEGRSVRETLENLIRPPYFPVALAGVPSRLRFLRAGPEPLRVGAVTASSLPLNHPDGSLAWRLEYGGRRVLFATDHEHGNDAIDAGLERFADGADLLIYDATYVPSEYESMRRGWGHSTWYAAVALARAARVRRLVLFHHHPDHSDDELERLLEFARADFPATDLAREGQEFTL